MTVTARTRKELRHRRHRVHGCWDHLLAASLWPTFGVNLGTLLRTCDAVGACLVVPDRPWIAEALAEGNTLRRPACDHRLRGRPGRLAGRAARHPPRPARPHEVAYDVGFLLVGAALRAFGSGWARRAGSTVATTDRGR